MKQPSGLLPREKAKQFGIEALSDAELLAIILSSGYKGNSVHELSQQILRRFNGLGGLLRLSIPEIMTIKGIKLAKATQLAASLEMVRRISYQQVLDHDVISDPKDFISWLRIRLGLLEQEYLLVVFLDPGNRVMGYQELFRGTVDNVQINSRDIFLQAIRNHCTKIIISHNHPSQSVAPSNSDIIVTEEIINAGRLLKIAVIDHIIVSFDDYYSFREHGLI